jgi:CIC family chloride channel protein
LSTHWKDRLHNWASAERLRQHENKVLLILVLLLGAIIGLVVTAFILVTENLGARIYPANGPAWHRLVFPVAGALISGILLSKSFPNARGTGIPQTKAALFLHNGFIKFRTAVGKFLVCSLTLASGISLGPEGPAVQIAGGIASSLGRRLGLSPDKVRGLVPAGCAAALAAAFNIPVSAVLFTLEEVMGDLHAPVLGSAVLSSAISWIVMHLVLGDEPLFHVPSYQLVHPIEFLFYALLGIAGGLVSVGFVKLLLWQRKHFMRLPKWTEPYQPVAGGLVCGLLGLMVPSVLGVGYNHVGEALNGQMAFKLMFLLVGMKLLATVTSYASGNSGGTFAPSLFIGAMLGGTMGSAVHTLLPDYTGSAGAYALVGMGATFVGIIRAPLTSVIMIFEITRDYSIIVPVMIANLVAFIISYRLQPVPINDALQHQDGIHLPESRREQELPMTVQAAVRLGETPLSGADTVEEALWKLEPDADAWPVARVRELLGLITRERLKQEAAQGNGARRLDQLLPVVEDPEAFISEDFPHVHLDHPLDLALRRMVKARTNVLPVVSRADVRRLVGVVTRQDIHAAYERGEEEHREVPAAVHAEEAHHAPGALLGGVAIVTLFVLILVGVVTRIYRVERQQGAQADYQTGQTLLAQGHAAEAVEQLRDALSVDRQNINYRLALGSALVADKHYGEASIYLSQVLSSDPENGRANLEAARVSAAEGDTQDAIAHYRRAVYGSWPAGAQSEAEQAHFEMAAYLAKSNMQRQAIAELVSLAEQQRATPEDKKRAGQLLIGLQAYQRAVDVLTDVLRSNDRDSEAYAALGQAQFRLGQYRIARNALQNAVKWGAAEGQVQNLLQVSKQILALDPTARGVSLSERRARSIELIRQALASLKECAAPPAPSVASAPAPPAITAPGTAAAASKPAVKGGSAAPALPSEVQPLVAQAERLLKRRPGASSRDSLEDNLSLAQELWSARQKLCGSPSPDEALVQVMALVSK